MSSDAGKIADYLKIISDKKPEIKVVVVDTINTIMSDKEIADRKRPGFDKWAEYASDIYDLYSIANKLRDDLIVIFMAHIEEYQVDGSTFYRTKTGGQKLTKLNLNSKLTYNLYTQVEREGDKPMYYFITQNMGNTEARSTEGVLDIKMPNDLSEVVSRIRKYDLGIEDTN